MTMPASVLSIRPARGTDCARARPAKARDIRRDLWRRACGLELGYQTGEALAEIIGTSSTPAILDTSLMKVSARTRFFADFADALVRRNKGPLQLIIDEAHLFAPQGKVNDPQSGAMLHAANNLVSLGRSRGLRIILITQRPAKLHKDSLTQVETLSRCG